MFIPRGAATSRPCRSARARLMSRIGLRVLAERENVVDTTALGPQAREEEPVFWQVGGLIEDARGCFELTVQLEEALDVHVASCSTDTVVYKVLGSPGARSAATSRTSTTAARRPPRVLGHNRYSTNTWPVVQARAAVRRARPQRRDQHDRPAAPGGAHAGRAADRGRLGLAGPEPHGRGADPPRGTHAASRRSSWCCRRSSNEIKGMPEELRGFYMYLRQAFGPFAQGPVALVSRHGDECVFSVDALGLRPLWSPRDGRRLRLLLRARRGRGGATRSASRSRSRRARS